MWEELYKTYYPELLRYAAAACQNQTAAEDLAQDIFLKALQNCDTLEDLGPSQKRAWLYRTLKTPFMTAIATAKWRISTCRPRRTGKASRSQGWRRWKTPCSWPPSAPRTEPFLPCGT